MGGQRMGRDVRRRLLVDAGEAAFAARPYESVQMDAVARAAGVSRALLYQHFAGKRDLFAAVYQRAADRLLDVTVLDADESLLEQVAAGLDAHIDYFVANREAVLTANRTLAGDPVIQAIISEELRVLRERVLAAAQVPPDQHALWGSILMSWLVLVRVLCVEWLLDPSCSRETLRDVCTGALAGALAATHAGSGAAGSGAADS